MPRISSGKSVYVFTVGCLLAIFFLYTVFFSQQNKRLYHSGLYPHELEPIDEDEAPRFEFDGSRVDDNNFS